MKKYLLPLGELEQRLAREPSPLRLADLDNWAPEASLGVLPPWPVIGLGDSAHPLAVERDCAIWRPVHPDSLIRTISANPAASAVFVQFLRSTAGIDMARGPLGQAASGPFFFAFQGNGSRAGQAGWLAKSREKENY